MRLSTSACLIALVAVAAAGCSTGTPAAPQTPSTTPAPTAAKGVHDIRGQITAENGTTWTVTTAKGMAITVDLNAQTAFGRKAQPATAAQFSVGSQVRVAGTRAGSTITATRITIPKAGPTTAPTTAPTATPTTTPSASPTG